MTAHAALTEKYRTLVTLRERREEVEAEGRDRFSAAEGAARKKAFRALARRFPSALSELDLPAAELRRRQALVARGIEGRLDSEERHWLEAMGALHLGLRLLLAARRWMRRHGGDEAAFRRFCQRFEARTRGHGGRDAAGWAAALGLSPEALFAFVVHPPEGRWRPHLERALGLAS